MNELFEAIVILSTHPVLVGQAGPERRRGPGTPIDMLGPPINKLTLSKTAAFVPNFKLRPPPDKRLATLS